MIKQFGFALLALFCFSGLTRAQDDVRSDVHLFQGFLKDSPINSVGYGEGSIVYGNYDFLSTFGLSLRGGYPINPQVELNAGLGFSSMNPDQGDGQSGLEDIYVGGRYNIVPGPTNISAGGYLTLPVGEEKIGEGNLNFGAFGALRHPLENGMVITGLLGLDFIEMETYSYSYNPVTMQYDTKTDSDYKTSLLLGAGVIYPLDPQINIVGEFNMMTETDYALLSGGVDYQLNNAGRLRGALGFGLDNGAPDFMLMAGYLFNF
ncbi:MAG: transporter [Calditrichia bacterium]